MKKRGVGQPFGNPRRRTLGRVRGRRPDIVERAIAIVPLDNMATYRNLKMCQQSLFTLQSRL